MHIYKYAVDSGALELPVEYLHTQDCWEKELASAHISLSELPRFITALILDYLYLQMLDCDAGWLAAKRNSSIVAFRD